MNRRDSCQTRAVAEPGRTAGERTTDPRLRIAIVDDHQMVLSGLQAWVKAADGAVQVVIAAASWAELLEHPAFPVDVVLLDLDLGDGIPVPLKISTLRQAGVAVVIILPRRPAHIRACLAAGAAGYLPKSEPADEILRAVTIRWRRQAYTTPSLAALLVADREDNAEDAPHSAPRNCAL